MSQDALTQRTTAFCPPVLPLRARGRLLPVVQSFRQRYDSPVDMALVGFTRSYNDLQWLEMARVCAATHEPAMADAWATATQEVFDLRGGAGRNFLDDGGEYQVVVLFAIYNPPTESPDFRKALGRRRGPTSLALNHSRERWARRLSDTQAKYLFVFRREDSVDGRWLGDIDRYEKLPEEAGVFGVSIYRRRI